ncbi:conserved Plasmodium protein, unknown function [Plasmodium sp. gorilla clade G2]|uniref:conserved Plasmodium protein, unknown function n=1 Tax=Plasmodium sp. gorilla clade G2 TaxID=880535 RepID=UPI000D203286|nr:conserved Plasmodium protein, unknown function [Plasmodium sp. gorilla clade G2]SOV18908.1 conserved Plasmodium protein, unknown function [Plasmodium sp. gorilla clade G2]
MELFKEISQDESNKDSKENDNINEEIDIEQLKDKVKDLELQLEYEIKQHNVEIEEREETIKMLETKIQELEHYKNDVTEKDEAIINMSEKLLILSNKYDILVKESKLQEEELKHFKNKKKYRNDKTNEYILGLKNQNNEIKKEHELLNEKYAQLVKEYAILQNTCKVLNVQLENNQKNMELLIKEKSNNLDEKTAIKILNIGSKEFIHKRVHNKNVDELSNLKLELEYKDMILNKLMRKQISSGKTVKVEYTNNENIFENEKKLDEMYQKYLDSVCDNDNLKKEINKLHNKINDMKLEEEERLKTISILRDYINKMYKEDVNVNQFDDLINNILKDNTSLNEELSKQKRKNMADIYYFTKELQTVKKDKFKIIEKFDSKKVTNIPHLYEPLNVTLSKENNKREISDDDNNKEPKGNLNFLNKNSDINSSESNIKKSLKTSDLAHIYMQDYMNNVQNKA